MSALILDDIIAAPATAEGASAIAIIRISGPGAVELVAPVFRGTRLADMPGGSVRFGHIADGDRIVDEVLVSVFRAPYSYTSQDTVEISCHGSVYVRSAILQLMIRAGARMAEPGEFTKRAFLNGKMDLSRAEAVADLIASESEAAARVAISQLRGGISRELDALREELIGFAALIELELDFGEEDVEFADRTHLIKLLHRCRDSMTRLCRSFSVGNAIKNGVPVAIVGAPNAGKSTLLNALLCEERAIVSPIPGTTRDAIEDVISIAGISYRFIDTAGLRRTNDEVERIGISRTLERAASARVVVYLYDAGQSESIVETEYRRFRVEVPLPVVIAVANKCDVAPAMRPNWASDYFVPVSALLGTGLHDLGTLLATAAGVAGLDTEATVITNARHYQCLVLSLDALDRVEEGMAADRSGDMLAQDLRDALLHMGNITGRIEPDRDVLGAVFSKFCIGK